MLPFFRSPAGSKKTDKIKANSPMGMLIKNTDLQPKEPTSHPPTFGPMIWPIGKMLLNSPIIFCLDSGKDVYKRQTLDQ